MVITLVRHTEVIEEFAQKYNGHIDIPLSKKGIEDAKKLSYKLNKKSFKKVYCSDLLRTKETLKYINIDAEVIYTKELREKSWGKYEGKSFIDIQNDGIKYKNFYQWIEDIGGEDIALFKMRVERYFKDIILKENEQNILVVTHSGVIKTLLGILNNLTLEEAFSINLKYGDFVEIDMDDFPLFLI